MNNIHKSRRSRQTAGHASRREAILDAADENLSSEGMAGLALRRVASVAGYVPAALYAYFPTKQILTRALATRRLGALGRQMKAAGQNLTRKGNPEIVLRATAHAGLRALCEEPAFYLLLGSLLPTDTATSKADAVPAEEERSLTGRFIALLETLAQPLRDLGTKTRETEANRQAVTLGATILGLALMESAGRLDALGLKVESLCDEAVANAVRNLKSNSKG